MGQRSSPPSSFARMVFHPPLGSRNIKNQYEWTLNVLSDVGPTHVTLFFSLSLSPIFIFHCLWNIQVTAKFHLSELAAKTKMSIFIIGVCPQTSNQIKYWGSPMKQSTRLSQLLFPSVCLSLSIYRPSSCSLLSYPCYLAPGGLQPEKECKVGSMCYGQDSLSAI